MQILRQRILLVEINIKCLMNIYRKTNRLGIIIYIFFFNLFYFLFVCVFYIIRRNNHSYAAVKY